MLLAAAGALFVASPEAVGSYRQAAAALSSLDFDFCGGRSNVDGSHTFLLDAAADLAILLSEDEMKAYAGVNVTGIYFNLKATGNVETFVMRKADGKILASAAVENPFGLTEVKFDTPLKLDAGDGELFVGVSAPKDASVVLSGLHHERGNFIRFNSGSGVDEWTSGFKGDEGVFAIGLTLEGENMPVDARIREAQYTLEPLDGVCHVTGFIENMSTSRMTQCVVRQRVSRPRGTGDDVVCTVGDAFTYALTTANVTIQAEAEPGGLVPFELDVPLKEEGMLTMELYVTSVNGSADAIPGNGTGRLPLYAGGRSGFTRGVVVEEGTGTWCGNCVIGIAAIDRMKRKYPETFIPISLHDDNMRPLDNYMAILGLFDGLPSSIIDRKPTLMPYPTMEALESMYLQESTLAKAGLKASAEFSDHGRTGIRVQAETEFGDSSADSYMIATAVTEDNLGPYYQTAYATPEQLGMEYDFSRMIYNDVARDIDYPAPDTPQGNIPGKELAGQKKTFDFTVSVPRNVRDLDSMRVAVMLIDRETGIIENACSCGISPYSGLGIEKTDVSEVGERVCVNDRIIYISGATDASVYSTDGTLLGIAISGSFQVASPGLYIVRTPGSAHRILVR